MITARLAKNKYNSEILIDGKPVDVLDAAIEYEGKRRVLVIRVAEFQLLPESACPEKNRFEDVMRAFNDSEAIRALGPSCKLIQMNPRACHGCPDRPI